MKVYLAGPMRGIDQFNFPAFHAATADLRKGGYTVLSPAENDEAMGVSDPTLNDLTGWSFADAMRWDIASILEADLMVVLPGWEASSGVALEASVARGIGCPIVSYPELEPV